jgi:hypothetical protein
VIRRQVETGIGNSGGGGDTFGNIKIKEVRQFIWVRRPVSGFARGEMVEVSNVVTCVSAYGRGLNW